MLIYTHGDVPEEAPEKTFSADKDEWNDDSFEENGLDEDIEDRQRDGCHRNGCARADPTPMHLT